MTPTHDTELDALLALLERAGLVEQFTDDQGRVSMRLTSKGAQVARQIALSGDAGGAVGGAVLEGG